MHCRLRFILFSFLGILLTACMPSGDAGSTAQKAIEPENSTVGQKSEKSGLLLKEEDLRGRVDPIYKEAPSLSLRVRSGELPPIEDRLPDNPLVIDPVSEPGLYGGTLRRALIAEIIDRTAIAKTLNDNLMGWERPLSNRMVLNLAESYEFQDEGRSILFKLRRGTRWSDGVPFSVADILFWYEDVNSDENARNTPIFLSRFLNGGRPVMMEKVDNLTLKISSHKPLGTILQSLCYDEFALPRHHLARYHPRYNPDATYEDFRKRTSLAMLAYTPDIPRLTAWVPVEWVRSQHAVFERNPYYWKVDTEGNQLPYIDRLEFLVIPNSDVILLKFLNGELDIIGRYFVATNYEVLKERERMGTFTVYYTAEQPGLAVYLNWDTPRENLREAFRIPQVRKALSFGINRSEIGEIAYKGLSEPTGISFAPVSSCYTPEGAKRYSQHDPKRARNLLDEAGYHDHDGDGYREFKDGSRFEITIDVLADTNIPDISELMVEHWKEIGIKTHLNIALQEIIVPRRINGVFDITISGSPLCPLINPEKFSATSPSEPIWHRNAIRDSQPWMKEITTLIRDALTTVDPNRRVPMMNRIRDLHVENLPFLTLGEIQGIWAASKKLGNVPPLIRADGYTGGWDRAHYSEQMYFRAQP